MLGLELVVVLGIGMLACHLVADRLAVPAPILLLLTGVGLGFVPRLRDVELSPDVVLFLFLPALLYWESVSTSLREIRRNLRGVILVSTVLVVLSATAVSVTAQALGLHAGPAWVLGAALAPTDATAVGVLGRILPRHNQTMLRAESLINDGTALVLFAVAVSVTTGHESLRVLPVVGQFAWAYAGGGIVGIAVALVATKVRHRVHDPVLENVVTILTPFTAYLVAETVHSSGVIAVVVSGLAMTQSAPRVAGAATRRQTEAFWSLATFLLNGALFVLVGIESNVAVRNLSGASLGRGLALVAAVVVVLVVVRVTFLFGSAYLIRAVDRRPQQRLRRVGHRSRIVSGVAGFRGAVSLAAALSVPTMIAPGTPFAERDTIVFVVAGVIAAMLLQALALPHVVRWARLPDDASEEERRLGQRVALQDALDALPDLAAELDSDDDTVAQVRGEYQEHLDVLQARDDEDAEPGADDDDLLGRRDRGTELRLAMLGRKRDAVIRLRDEHRIDDGVLLELQRILDLEEVRLGHRHGT